MDPNALQKSDAKTLLSPAGPSCAIPKRYPNEATMLRRIWGATVVVPKLWKFLWEFLSVLWDGTFLAAEQ